VVCRALTKTLLRFAVVCFGVFVDAVFAYVLSVLVAVVSWFCVFVVVVVDQMLLCGLV
jgi:hypothetical protein